VYKRQVQAYAASITSALLALFAILRWLWDTDRPIEQDKADIGAGIEVPTYVTGRRSQGWWAMVTLLVVIGMIFLLALFGFAYLWGRKPEYWVAPPAFWSLAPIWAGYAVMAFGPFAARRVLAGSRMPRAGAALLMLFAAAAGTAAIAMDFAAWGAVVNPGVSGQGAAVHAILSLLAVLSAIAVLMALYVAARARSPSHEQVLLQRLGNLAIAIAPVRDRKPILVDPDHAEDPRAHTAFELLSLQSYIVALPHFCESHLQDAPMIGSSCSGAINALKKTSEQAFEAYVSLIAKQANCPELSILLKSVVLRPAKSSDGREVLLLRV